MCNKSFLGDRESRPRKSHQEQKGTAGLRGLSPPKQKASRLYPARGSCCGFNICSEADGNRLPEAPSTEYAENRPKSRNLEFHQLVAYYPVPS
jgi:hypothetical protein